MSPLRFVLLFVCLTLATAGCGGSPTPTSTPLPAVVDGQTAEGAGQPPAEAPGGNPNAPDVRRKIVTTAWIDLTVADVEAARKGLLALVAETKGYLAETDDHSGAAPQHLLKWTIRVPAEHAEAFLTATARFGETTRNARESKDVTAEFVDLTARHKNLLAEEEALNRLLKEAAKEIGDVLKVREQVSRVRIEIERAEGRIKLLSQLSALSTVHLTVRGVAAERPKPTFGGRIGSTFDDSVEGLQQFGKSAVLIGVAVAPWLPIVVLGLLLARRVKRRMASL